MRRADSNQKVASARPTPATASHASIPAATVTLTNPTRRIGMTTTASPGRCAGNLHAPSCPAAAQQDHRRLPLLSDRIPPCVQSTQPKVYRYWTAHSHRAQPSESCICSINSSHSWPRIHTCSNCNTGQLEQPKFKESPTCNKYRDENLGPGHATYEG